MKYFTLALLLATPCLAQASQYVTGVISSTRHGYFQIQEVATDLPECRSIEQVRANPAACMEGRTVDVRDSGIQVQGMSGNLVRLAGTFEVATRQGVPFLYFNLSPNGIEVLSPAQPQQQEPCGNYNGVCH